MKWFGRGVRVLFLVLFGILFSGVFAMLAFETAIRRWRDDRRAAEEAPASELEAGYRARLNNYRARIGVPDQDGEGPSIQMSAL